MVKTLFFEKIYFFFSGNFLVSLQKTINNNIPFFKKKIPPFLKLNFQGNFSKFKFYFHIFIKFYFKKHIKNKILILVLN